MSSLPSELDSMNCCGCTACYSICPTSAIKMAPDHKGFLYPIINSETCIHCEQCVEVCNFPKFVPHKSPEFACFAARLKDKGDLKASQSGGFFIAIAEDMLDNGGVVFGCEMEDSYTAIHKAEMCKADVRKFRGSKYVQSDMRDCYRECGAYLLQARPVLFSGTACQIHGLLSYLNHRKIPLEGLVTVDLVCHGVPSPLIWKQFVSYIEKKQKNAVARVLFRDKAGFGWKAHRINLCLKSGRHVFDNGWTHVFYKHIMLRESCYHCSYTTPYRNSDFTIGDYWGVGKVVQGFDDDCGVSLVLTHTKKAKEILERISERLDRVEADIETALCTNPNLSAPTQKGAEYTAFWGDFEHLKQERFMRKWFFPSKAQKAWRALKKRMRR